MTEKVEFHERGAYSEELLRHCEGKMGGFIIPEREREGVLLDPFGPYTHPSPVPDVEVKREDEWSKSSHCGSG